MNFLQNDLGRRERGEVVEVTLSAAANVRLMDSSNFSSYKRRQRHTYYGGYVKRSPYRLTIPSSGHWHVAIDLGGYAGTVRAGVSVLPGRLKPASEAPLSSVPSLLRPDPENYGIGRPPKETREFDVFISHASEDKDKVARPMAQALQEAGLRVWFDEFELRIGDSLRQRIDQGLVRSRFGLIVMSKAFFSKGWTNYELDGLVTRAVSGEQVLLPIWHNVTKAEVIKYSPSLADRLARSTAIHTIEEIAAEIVELISGGEQEQEY